MKSPYNFAKDWVKKRFTAFTVEDLRQAYTMAGGKINGDGSEWGNVLMKLQKQELIFKHPTLPFMPAIRPNGKKKYIINWISRELRLKQQRNATSDKDSLTLDL